MKALEESEARIGSALAGFPEPEFHLSELKRRWVKVLEESEARIGSALAGFPEPEFVADAPNIAFRQRCRGGSGADDHDGFRGSRRKSERNTDLGGSPSGIQVSAGLDRKCRGVVVACT